MLLESMLVRALNSGRKPSATRPSGLYLGISKALIGGEQRPFFLSLHPPQHSLSSGRTGTGKTTLQKRIQAKHFSAGVPFLNIDQHGADTDELMGHAQAAGVRCLALESWAQRVVGCNALNIQTESHYEAAREHVAICRKHLFDAWGSHLELAVFMLFLALLQAGCTFAELILFLLNPGFRRAVLRRVRLPEVREYWSRFEGLSPSRRAALTDSLLSKFAALNDPQVKYVLGQQKGSLDFDKVLAEGQTVLYNNSTGKSQGNWFLTSLFLATLRNSVHRRPVGARPFAVFLDEFKEAVGHEFLEDYLRAFRKRNVSVYLGTQDLDLSPALKSAIFGNCSRFFCFASNATDAAFFGREFGGPEGALISDMLPELKTGQAIVKVRGEPAHLLQVDPVSPPSGELIARGRANCLRLGKSRAEIDAEIEQRQQRIISNDRRTNRDQNDSRRDRSDAHMDHRTTNLPEGYDGY